MLSHSEGGVQCFSCLNNLFLSSLGINIFTKAVIPVAGCAGLRWWDSQRQILPVKTEVKTLSNIVLSHHSLCCIWAVGQHFYTVPFTLYISVESFFAFLLICFKIKLQMGFGFPNPIPAQRISLHSSCSHFHIFYAFILCLSLVRSKRHLAAFAWFPACQDRPFFSLE